MKDAHTILRLLAERIPDAKHFRLALEQDTNVLVIEFVFGRMVPRYRLDADDIERTPPSS
jgi:hypothetical protein